MASNSIYQNGKNPQQPQSNGNGSSTNNNNNNNNFNSSVGSLHKSSSSNFNMKTSNGGIGNTQTLPNGYRMHANKIPTKAEIDYHLENFIMTRKIALNGGNELRIDDKNISLHLNNPFVTAAYAQQIQAQKAFMQQQHHQQQQHHFPHNNFIINETISESTIPSDQAVRPKRPHSIAVSSPITMTTSLDNDLNLATTFSRRQKITTPNIVSGGVINKMTTTAAGNSASPINFAQFNHLNGTSPNARVFPAARRNEFALYTPPSPVANEVGFLSIFINFQKKNYSLF